MGNNRYNGAELPVFPDYDEIQFPNYIIGIEGNIATLYLHDINLVLENAQYPSIIAPEKAEFQVIKYTVNLENINDPDAFRWEHVSSQTATYLFLRKTAYIHFSNYDICFEDTDVAYFAGSVPVPIGDDENSTENNYRYNGVELPVLPDRDVTQFLNYVIGIDGNTATLYIHDAVLVRESAQNTSLIAPDNAEFQVTEYTVNLETINDPETFKWEVGSSRTTTYLFSRSLAYLCFSNYDILFEGSDAIYFAGSEPVPVDGSGDSDTEGEFGDGDVVNSASFSLKNFLTGILNELTAEQSPIVTALPIVAYRYNGVRLGKVPDTQSVGKMFAVIVGGTDGKYHLYLSTEKMNVWKNGDLNADAGLVTATTYTFYMVYANYSLEDGSLLNGWTSYETEVLPTVGTLEAGTVLEDQFVSDGILWSSYNLYGDDGELRNAASRIYPITEVGT